MIQSLVLSFVIYRDQLIQESSFFLLYLFIGYILMKSICSHGLHKNDSVLFFSGWRILFKYGQLIWI